MTEANEPNYIFVNNVTTLKRMEKKIIQISWEKQYLTKEKED